MKFTEDDLCCWGYHKAYLIEILNGEYTLEDARSDLAGLVGSKFDPRITTLENKEANLHQSTDQTKH